MAVLLWASPKMLHIWVRREVVGPSSGISTANADVRVDADARDLRVWVDDLSEIAEADDLVDRADTWPGILIFPSL